MATHNYTVVSLTFLSNPSPANPDPPVAIVGTVDGQQFTVYSSHSSIVQLPNAVAFQNLIGPLLLAAWNAANPSPSTIPPLSSSWTA